jgi:hypothetical protein
MNKVLMLALTADIKALMEIVRLAKRITKTEPLAGIVAGGAVPGPDVQSDEQLEAYVLLNDDFLLAVPVSRLLRVDMVSAAG